MERKWKIVLGAVGVLVGLAVGGFLLASGSGGILGEEVPATGEAFSGAEERFTGTSTGDGMTRTHSFDVDPGHASMTVYMALVFPDAGSAELRDPSGSTVGQASQRVQEIPVIALVEHRPDPGSWEMVVRCEGVCQYTVAASMGDELSSPEASLEGDVSSHDEVLHVSHDQDATGRETFEVPREAQSLRWASSLYAADGMQVTLTDPSGTEVRSMGWGAEWLVRGLTNEVTESPQSGTWTIEYSCSVTCQGAWGFSYAVPPGEDQA